jgi:RNA polymerase sigma-70 factor (ECF subfamily)
MGVCFGLFALFRPASGAGAPTSGQSGIGRPVAAGEGGELLERIGRGDVQAMRQVYQTCAGRARAVAAQVLRSRSEADEVVQETFVELWRRARTAGASSGPAASWVVTIARSRAIDRVRARTTAERTALAAANEELPPAVTPFEDAEQRQNEQRVRIALGTLPSEQRQVIELAYFEGLSQREIAERTGDPLGTVKTRVRLAMEKLAVELGDAALTGGRASGTAPQQEGVS